MAQLVIYYPASFFWLDRSAGISLVTKTDDCALKQGTFFIRDIAPGAKTRIAATICGMPAISELYIKAAANSTYYIRITPNDDTLTGHMGNSRLAKPMEKLKYGGPFRIDIMARASALNEIQPLHPCAQCMAGNGVR